VEQHAYGANIGDVGSTTAFLEPKFGGMLRLNPPVWKLLSPHCEIIDELFGVELDFCTTYAGTLKVRNVYENDEQAQKAFAMFQ
jgi:hypothetical protein